MFTLPPNLTPSQLIRRDKLRPEAQRLFSECDRIRREWRCGQIEQAARDAQDLWRKSNDRIGCAAGLLRLADVCREMGRLGPAQRYGKRARDMFHQDAAPSQRFNEAMAAYALGLTHQFLGDEKEACDHYQLARGLLEQAKEHFHITHDNEQAKECERISSWLEKLIKYVADIRFCGATTAFPSVILVCSRPSGTSKPECLPVELRIEECLPVELRIEEYLLAQEARIADTDFRLHPVNKTVTLKPGEEYCVVKVPEQGMPDAGLEKGDYALIQGGEDAEGIGVTLAEDEVLFGRFERRKDGSFNFIPSDLSKPPRIIPDDLM
nr:hypothetical protein [Chloroflexota bacterium]